MDPLVIHLLLLVCLLALPEILKKIETNLSSFKWNLITERCPETQMLREQSGVQKIMERNMKKKIIPDHAEENLQHF